MPKRPSKSETDPKAASNPPSDETAEDTKPSTLNPPKDIDEPRIEIVSPASVENGSDKECARLRAVLNANIGACHVKLVSQISSVYHKLNNATIFLEGDHKAVVEACSQGRSPHRLLRDDQIHTLL